jgi:hypothetical protein
MASNEPAAKRIAAHIDGKEIGSGGAPRWRLAVIDMKPVGPRAGWLYFAVAIRSGDGPLSRTPLLLGIASGGGRGVSPWFEGRLFPEVELADGTLLDARGASLEAAIVNLLGEAIPAGGHLMIDYETPGQAGTHEELLLRVPPAASHLGALMFKAGFRGAFKDWYFSEGGHEGPRKLQANKSPTEKAAREALRNHAAELRAFLKREAPADPRDAAIIARAKNRARELLDQFIEPKRKSENSRSIQTRSSSATTKRTPVHRGRR